MEFVPQVTIVKIHRDLISRKAVQQVHSVEKEVLLQQSVQLAHINHSLINLPALTAPQDTIALKLIQQKR